MNYTPCVSNQTLLRSWLPLLVAALHGCVPTESRLTGNEGNLEFSYPADDDIVDFNKPIAIGARLDLQVAAVGSHQGATVLSATTAGGPASCSGAGGVLDVTATFGDTITVAAVTEGQALLEVAASTGAGTMHDSVNLLARKAERLELRHACTSQQSAPYLVGQAILIGYELRRNNGQHVIGYGYHPVQVTPASGLVLDSQSKDQQHLHFQAASTKQTVKLASTIDATSLVVDLVTPGDVDGVVLDSALSVPVGTSGGTGVRPTIAGQRLCQGAVALQVKTETPGICSVTVGGGASNWLAVTGKALGKCQFALTLPDAKGGAGLTVPFTVDVPKVTVEQP